MFLFAVLLYIASVCNLLLVCLVTALWLDACRLPTYCVCCVSVLLHCVWLFVSVSEPCNHLFLVGLSRVCAVCAEPL